MALKLLSSRLKYQILSHFKGVLSYWQSESISSRTLHTSSVNFKVEKWLDQNDWVYPPQKPDEARRPGWVTHCRENIKYSPKKMWYVACLVRGMSVDNALKQLSHVAMRGAVIAKEVIEEAQELAIKENNVEYKSNLWVAQSFVGKGFVVKGIRNMPE